MAPQVSSKSLRLRWADRCVLCQTELAAGQQAIWYPGPRVVTCLGCALPPSQVPTNAPGDSSARKYERLHRKREDHARETFGALGVFLARVIDEPQSTKAWKKGAEGEARAGARLEKLLEGTGVELLHDRMMPGATRANIDHIAVGPGGITVIDTKNYRGKVRVERIGGLFSERRDVLMIGGRDRTKLVEGVERQVAAVRSVLDGTGAVDVRGALCFADVDGLPLLRRLALRDILIDGTRSVAKLARRPGPLISEQVDQLRKHLSVALPPA
jgi:Nuclease-related domain